MARQFREQLEEEVQLEEARKAQRSAAPMPPEPPPDEAKTVAGQTTASGRNGRSPLVTHDTTHRDPPSDATAADPTAAGPAQAAGADERRT